MENYQQAKVAPEQSHANLMQELEKMQKRHEDEQMALEEQHASEHDELSALLETQRALGEKKWADGKENRTPGWLARAHAAHNAAALEKESVVVDPYDDIVDKATETLNGKGITGVIRDANKESGSYIGTVAVVNDKFAAVDIGRNHLIVMPNTISNARLEVGQKVNLKFRDGVGQEVSRNQSQSREQGMGR